MENNIDIYEPEVRYRGSRNYLHTADFYECMCDGANQVGMPARAGPVVMNIRRLTRKQPRYCFGREAVATSSDDVVMDFRYVSEAGEVAGWVVERDADIAGNKPYDESRIWGPAELDGKHARLDADTGMAPIEVITALGVLQHKTLYPPPEGRRWLCVRVNIARPLVADDANGVDVEMVQMIGGRISKSVVDVGGERLGHMSFILGEP
jgi:hypothetical protein